jgi:hypothetical protein
VNFVKRVEYGRLLNRIVRGYYGDGDIIYISMSLYNGGGIWGLRGGMKVM